MFCITCLTSFSDAAEPVVFTANDNEIKEMSPDKLLNLMTSFLN